MKDLADIVSVLEADLDARDRAREMALKESRAITRLAGSAMRGMIRGEGGARELDEARRRAAGLRSRMRGAPELWHARAVEGALQEVAEAAIVDRVLRRRRLPAPRALGVTSAAYVLGLGDAIGELRRLALDRVRHGDLGEATRLADAMEELFHALMRFEYPDAIVAVRHKQDVARSLLERTRGELALAVRSHALEARLDALEKAR